MTAALVLLSLTISVPPPEIAIPSLERLIGYDLAGAIDRLGIPFHAINSDRFPASLEVNRRHAGRFGLTLMPGTGHFPMLEKTAQFEGILEKVVTQATIHRQSP